MTSAQRHGYNPEIILAGRRMNDGMGEYVATQTIKLMLKKGIQVIDSDILILGFTFKENCPDVRNTKVIDIYKALKEYNLNVTVYDPWANPDAVKRKYGIDIVNDLSQIISKQSTVNGKSNDIFQANSKQSTVNGKPKFDACIAAVAHKKFEGLDILTLLKEKHVVFDVKCTLDRNLVDGRL